MVRHTSDHIGFSIASSKIRNNVYIPKYYDPEITLRLAQLGKTHQLVLIADLLAMGHLTGTTGDEIGKMAYGSGVIPFVRTSDITNWEVKSDPKQGVSDEVYQKYAQKQDVQKGDILFVRDGTYLIGQCSFVTEADMPFVYQSHIIKFRVEGSSPVTPEVFFAALNSPIVKKQIRAKQFTADIIDTVGARFQEIYLPIPRNPTVVARVESEVRKVVSERVKNRERLRRIPFWAQGIVGRPDDPLPSGWSPAVPQAGNPGFRVLASDVRGSVLIPKYYDPKIERAIRALDRTHYLEPVGDMVGAGVLSWETGLEIGKMAYGTGQIPFIRTSDISNWELRGDPKQRVSLDIYETNAQDTRAGDILLVRDGTYLVGTSCILTEADTRILYCGGIYKLRVEKKKEMDPYLLFALLNMPIVRRQMRAKQFTRDIIDTLGKRLFEIILPIPRDRRLRNAIATQTREAIEKRVALRSTAANIARRVEGIGNPGA